MPKFLNVLNMNSNEIQNFAVHNVAAGSAITVAGSIILDGTDLKYYDGSNYITLGTGAGDITGVTLAGDSGSASDNSGNADLTIAGGTGITTSATGTTVTINADSSQAITALTGGDLTLYDDNNNADVSFKMGTGAAESLTIQVLNGSSNKTAEEVHFSTATASGTANHGKMVFDIDGTDIMEINDSGINVTGTLTADTSLTIDSVTLTDTELGYLDGITLGTAAASKVLTLDSSGNIDSIGTIGSGAITSTGNITSGGSFIIGNASMNETDLEKLDGITNGTAAASKAVVLDSSKNIATIGTIGCGAITSSGTSSFSTAIQTPLIEFTDGDNAISIADGGGITAAAGITSTAAANTFGATSFNDADITNVGDIALDTISHDNNTISVSIKDNTDTAFSIKQGSDVYFDVDTRNGSEVVDIGTGISGTAINIGHGTSEVTIGDNLTVTGDLKVSGATTTVNTSTMTVKDPIIALGTADDGAAPSSDDNKDRGIAMHYHTGSAAKIAFLGFDDSAGDLTFIPDASISSEVVSGSQGTINANLSGNVTGNVSGSSGSCTGNAATATALASAVTINGTSFDGTSNITLSSGSVTNAMMADDAINTDEIADGAVDTAQLAADAVNGDKIEDDAINSEHIVDGSVDNAHLAGSIALSKLANQNDQTILGNNAGSAGAPTALTMANLRAMLGKKAFNLTDGGSSGAVVASNSNKTYTITHGLGSSLNYGVEVIRAANGSGETVYVDVTRTTTTIVINFSVAPTAGDYTALVNKF
jgi:hypothetical protein